MFGTIRKHQTWLWAVIITLTIISFVVFFSPYSKVSGGRAESYNYGSINGERVTAAQFRDAAQEVQLSYFFQAGRFPGDEKQSNFDLNRETYYWLLLVQQQQRMGIRVSEDEAARFGRQVLQQLQQLGVSSPAVFFQQVLAPHRLNAEDFERYCRHRLGLNQLMTATGVPGELLTPQAGRQLYEREHQEVATEVVFFSTSNYLASVTATPEAVSQFYSNNLSAYHLPERVQVDYVHFATSNYLAQAEKDLGPTNLTEQVEDNYRRLGTNTLEDAKTPEAIKAKIRDLLLRQQAQAIARKKALDFANTLSDMKPVQAQNLAALARSNALAVSVSSPFSKDSTGPKELEVGADFVKVSFQMSPEEPFAGPVAGRDGYYELALNKRLDSEIPGLDKVREQVTTDYQQDQARRLLYQAGNTLVQTLTNGLGQGKNFASLCAAAKVTPMDLPPISLSSPTLKEIEEHIPLSSFKQVVFGTATNQVSNFVPTRDGGLVVFVKNKLPLDTSKMAMDMPDFLKGYRQRLQNEAFNQWLRKAIEKGMRDTPLAQPKAPPNMGGTRKS
jgi:hypothetical protein